MQKGIQNDVVVIDFAKAFDKVAHNRLLYKLSAYGVKGNFSGRIGSFLTGRPQTAVLEGNHLRQLRYFQAFQRAQFQALSFFSFI